MRRVLLAAVLLLGLSAQGWGASWTDNLTLYMPFTDPANPYAMPVGSGTWVFERGETSTFVHPTTGLITLTPQNKLLDSEAFDRWSKVDASVAADNTTDPIGGNAADLVTEGSAGTAWVQRTFNVASGETYTGSFYAKYNGTQWIRVNVGESTMTHIARAWFDIQNGVVGGKTTTGANGIYVGHTITDVGGGWFRCTLSGAANGAYTTYAMTINSATANNSTTRVSGSKYWLWGGQANSGPRATAYVPTNTTSTVSTLGIEANGALFEGTRINLAKYSEAFDNTWTASNVAVTVDNAVAPDGNATADLLTASADNGTVTQPIATTGQWYGFSVYLKRATGTGNIDLTADNTTWATCAVNSTTWTRCQTGIVVDNVTPHTPGIRIVTSGDAVYAWGAQYEAGSVCAGCDDSWISSYIPTAATKQTRSREKMYNSTIAGNIDPKYGSFFAIADTVDTVTHNKFLMDLHAAAAVPMHIRSAAGVGAGGILGRSTIYENGAGSECSPAASNVDNNVLTKLASFWDNTTGNFGTIAAGGPVNTCTNFGGNLSSGAPTPNRIELGDSYSFDGTRTLWGHIKQMRVWSAPLSETLLYNATVGATTDIGDYDPNANPAWWNGDMSPFSTADPADGNVMLFGFGGR